MTPIRLLFALVTVLSVAACQPEPVKPYPHAIMRPEPKAPPAIAMTDADGKPLALADLEGTYTWIYFGFANCPDVCPAAMSFMADEYTRMKHPERVTPLFISVDPARDTPAKLKQYAKFYHPQLRAATAPKDQLDPFARTLGAAYVIDPPKAGSQDYNVSHTNMIFVIDPEGRYVATYVPGVTPGQMAADFDALAEK